MTTTTEYLPDTALTDVLEIDTHRTVEGAAGELDDTLDDPSSGTEHVNQ